MTDLATAKYDIERFLNIERDAEKAEEKAREKQKKEEKVR